MVETLSNYTHNCTFASQGVPSRLVEVLSKRMLRDADGRKRSDLARRQIRGDFLQRPSILLTTDQCFHLSRASG